MSQPGEAEEVGGSGEAADCLGGHATQTWRYRARAAGKGSIRRSTYGWKKQLLSSATKVFDERDSKRGAAEGRRKRGAAADEGRVAEITAENLELKKGSGARGSWATAAGVAKACA